eukprot:UN28865
MPGTLSLHKIATIPLKKQYIYNSQLFKKGDETGIGVLCPVYFNVYCFPPESRCLNI